MTYSDFYGSEYADILKTQSILVDMIESIKNSGNPMEDLQPVVYYCSRIKSPESMMDKLCRYGLPVTLDSALESVYDAVGIRIVCSFTSDVQSIVSLLENEPSIEVLLKKDYLAHPKPGGYRSIHLCIRVKQTGKLAEIQVRTLAMDFWATLEHQTRYKKSVSNDALLKSELKRCADEIASLDLSMQTIREIAQNI